MKNKILILILLVVLIVLAFNNYRLYRESNAHIKEIDSLKSELSSQEKIANDALRRAEQINEAIQQKIDSATEAAYEKAKSEEAANRKKK